mgnify:CR=1 FL=1
MTVATVDFSASAGHALLDGDAGRQTLDGIHVGLFELINKLPGIR